MAGGAGSASVARRAVLLLGVSAALAGCAVDPYPSYYAADPFWGYGPVAPRPLVGGYVFVRPRGFYRGYWGGPYRGPRGGGGFYRGGRGRH